MALSEKRIFCVCLAFRFVNGLLVRTWFVPDEYWQSVEPAHRLAFGYGHLTWEWKHGLRSYIYPLLFAAMFLLLKLFGIDTRELIVGVPKVFQSSLGAVGDVHLFKFGKRLFGEKVAFWVLTSYWFCWFGFYCTPRTLANSVETVLILVGFSRYPWPPSYLFDSGSYEARKARDELVYLTTACLSTIIRPTAALVWIPLCLWRLHALPEKVGFLFGTCLPVGLPILLASVIIDRLCYGRWLLSLWNFAEFNVFKGGSAHFGVHAWYWYLSHGLPPLLTLHSPLIIYGIWHCRNRIPLILCAWYILFHSLLAHKEHRFLLPIVPVLCLYSGYGLELMAKRKDKSSGEAKRKLEDSSLLSRWKLMGGKGKVVVLGLLVINLPIALYTGLVHQVGAVDVTKVLHEESKAVGEMSVWFLTPCCNTPYYSHVHAKIPMRFLTCDPNLNNTANYVDEADAFHQHPQSWLDKEMVLNRNQSWPTHVVLYEKMWDELKLKLTERSFFVLKRLFNTHFPQSSRQSSHFVVARRTL